MYHCDNLITRLWSMLTLEMQCSTLIHKKSSRNGDAMRGGIGKDKICDSRKCCYIIQCLALWQGNLILLKLEPRETSRGTRLVRSFAVTKSDFYKRNCGKFYFQARFFVETYNGYNYSNACLLVFSSSVIPRFIWPWRTAFMYMFWNCKQFSRAFSKQYGCASLLHAFERVLINGHSVYARMCRSKNLVRQGNFVILNAFPIFCHFQETYHHRKLGLGQDTFCLLQR